ncbi:hypothetical protein EDC04DRAFT_2604279 [Pisolithus marmoratus]|nr:hypothetical protein EDC04DRAFT_2604279 [Pisolithus marmoratus]
MSHGVDPATRDSVSYALISAVAPLQMANNQTMGMDAGRPSHALRLQNTSGLRTKLDASLVASKLPVGGIIVEAVFRGITLFGTYVKSTWGTDGEGRVLCSVVRSIRIDQSINLRWDVLSDTLYRLLDLVLMYIYTRMAPAVNGNPG